MGRIGQAVATRAQALEMRVIGCVNVGSDPYGVAFDGANIWVTNQDSGTVTKL